MRVGDVVTMKSCRVQVGNERLRGWAGFSAAKGERFVFLLLGVESDDKPLNPVEVLNKLGWKAQGEVIGPSERDASELFSGCAQGEAK